MNKKLLFQIKIVLIVLLLWALVPINPYGYYIFLRIVCFFMFGYIVYESYQNDKVFLVILSAMLAVLYNPVIRISLGREIWTVINIISALIIVVSMIINKEE